MKKTELLAIVNSICQEFQEEHLALPVRETALDSLDLLTLRSTLESRLGRRLSDEQWLSADTILALLEKLT